MKQTALKTLEYSINRYFALNSNTQTQQNYFAKLRGKIIAFHLKRPKVTLLFLFEANKIKLIEANQVNPELNISAEIYTSLFQLMRIKFKKHKSLVNSGFYIKGDIDAVKNLNELFEAHHIDWEEHLSKFTGDIVAHKTGKLFKKNKDYVQTIQSNLVNNMGEYLQEEAELLPHPLAVEHFTQELQELSLQVDRNQARLKLLEQQYTENHTENKDTASGADNS